MIIYKYDEDTGYFTGQKAAKRDPRRPGRFLIPGNATVVEPPAVTDPFLIQKYDPDTNTWSVVDNEIAIQREVREKVEGDRYIEGFVNVPKWKLDEDINRVVPREQSEIDADILTAKQAIVQVEINRRIQVEIVQDLSLSVLLDERGPADKLKVRQYWDELRNVISQVDTPDVNLDEIVWPDKPVL